jgi:hypothetical protein
MNKNIRKILEEIIGVVVGEDKTQMDKEEIIGVVVGEDKTQIDIIRMVVE